MLCGGPGRLASLHESLDWNMSWAEVLPCLSKLAYKVKRERAMTSTVMTQPVTRFSYCVAFLQAGQSPRAFKPHPQIVLRAAS